MKRIEQISDKRRWKITPCILGRGTLDIKYQVRGRLRWRTLGYEVASDVGRILSTKNWVLSNIHEQERLYDYFQKDE